MRVLSCVQHRYHLILASCVALIVLGFATAPAAAAQIAPSSATSTTRTIIAGQAVAALQGKTANNPLPNGQILHLTISLKLQGAQGLDALLAAQNDKTSPLYHHFLTPNQFATQFGPAQTTTNAVVSYLQGQGLTVEQIAANHLTINVTGTAAAVQQAFAVHLGEYLLGTHTVYAPMDDPSVPASLGAFIQGINGLDDVFSPHTLGESSSPLPQFVGSGPNGGYSPADLRTAYDMNTLINTDHAGNGQTIAVFEQAGYDINDLNHFRQHYGLGNANITNVNVDVPALSLSGTIEDALDLDTISGIAPNAALMVYMGPADPTWGQPGASFQRFTDVWQRIITDNIAKVISTSYGDCEQHFTSNELTTLDNLFKQAATQGQTVFAASGDEGPFDCQGSDSTISVDYPASDPYVVGVGGTSLYLNSNSTYNHETVWSCPYCTGDSSRPHGLASGGGNSTVFSRPSYQTGKGVGGEPWRQVPDVSADADGATGYAIYCTSTYNGSGCPSGWGVEGGTSGSAPLWAGMAADIDQYITTLGNPTFVLNNPLLYQLFNTTPSIFHDITQGNNLRYSALPGYDLATGIGTPDAWNIALQAAASTYTKYTSNERSASGYALATYNGALYVAWEGLGNGQLNLMHSTDGGKTFDSSTKYVSLERGQSNLALAVFNNALYIAWAGLGNGQLNLMHSTDGGKTFDSSTKYVSLERTDTAIAMAVVGSNIYISWGGIGNELLNLMRSTDGGKTFDSSTKYVSLERTSYSLSMAAVGNILFVSWAGLGNHFVNLMHSTDSNQTFDSTTKYVAPEMAEADISLANDNGSLYIAWAGNGNGFLNYMHSTDNNQTFNSSTKVIWLTETSPGPITLIFNANTLYLSWVGPGNYLVNVLSKSIA